MRIALVFGGRSSEHEVSLRSARNVRAALTRAGHEVLDIGVTRAGRWLVGENAQLIVSPEVSDRQDSGLPHLPDRPSRAALGQVDVVFPIMHGPNGEDGTLQGLLELANVPYVGCGVLGSALAMDKAVAKKLLGAAGIPQTPYRCFHAPEIEADVANVVARIEAAFAYPLFVKPANMGSSVGVSRVTDAASLARALQLAQQYDAKVLAEAAVPRARELEVSVLGWYELQASVPGEVIPNNEFYDYDAKYRDPQTRLLIPAPVTRALATTLQDLAMQVFRLLEGCGMGRVDFLMEADSGKVYVNEINTLPGFTSASMYPKLWEASGLDYGELMQRLLDLALERHARKQRRKTTI